jgi:hypothetical protein
LYALMFIGENLLFNSYYALPPLAARSEMV